jgi:hypothetical protein
MYVLQLSPFIKLYFERNVMMTPSEVVEHYTSTIVEALHPVVTPALQRSAVDLSAGERIAVIENEQNREVLALLTAVAATVGDEKEIHLVTDSVEQSTRLSRILESLAMEKPVVCATAESFVLAHLQGKGHPTEFALIIDAERTLLRDGHTPVIIAHTAETDDSVPSETMEEANRSLFKGRNYEVQNGEIVVRDAQTRELLPGRRFSGGLHAAVQKREGLAVQTDGVIVAQITIGEFFRRYAKLSAITRQQDAVFQNEYHLTP